MGRIGALALAALGSIGLILSVVCIFHKDNTIDEISFLGFTFFFFLVTGIIYLLVTNQCNIGPILNP